MENIFIRPQTITPLCYSRYIAGQVRIYMKARRTQPIRKIRAIVADMLCLAEQAFTLRRICNPRVFEGGLIEPQGHTDNCVATRPQDPEQFADRRRL